MTMRTKNPILSQKTMKLTNIPHAATNATLNASIFEYIISLQPAQVGKLKNSNQACTLVVQGLQELYRCNIKHLRHLWFLQGFFGGAPNEPNHCHKTQWQV